MVSTSSSWPIHGLWPCTRGRSVFSPRLASTGTLAGGGVCTWKGVEGGSVLAALVGGEAHPSISVITWFWEPGHKLQMASMLSLHDQGKGPWILLHVVSGPWTSFVAALDKGQCRKAVCRRHTHYQFVISKRRIPSVFFLLKITFFKLFVGIFTSVKILIHSPAEDLSNKKNRSFPRLLWAEIFPRQFTKFWRTCAILCAPTVDRCKK
jgi:hypothetical protein